MSYHEKYCVAFEDYTMDKKCLVCDKVFSTRDAVLKHVYADHPTDDADMVDLQWAQKVTGEEIIVPAVIQEPENR